MDSLRYFVIECHVDGFRFDLASALAREFHEVDRLGLLRHHPPGPCPLPGEADRGAVGRRRGRLPGRQLSRPLDGVERIYRDTMRDFWRARPGAEFAKRFTGSSDLYHTTAAGRSRRSTSSPPTTASRCATSSPTTRSTTRRTWKTTGTATTTTSWNHGVEGETDDPGSTCSASGSSGTSSRRFLSQGVPMLPAATRSPARSGEQQRLLPGQRAPWFDWNLDERRQHLLAFTKRLIAFRAPPGLPPADFLTGEERLGSGSPDVWWFRPDGRKMTQRTGRTALADAGRLPERRRDPDREPAGRAGDRRHLPDPLQRPG